ncbi:MAG: Gfo/Idh/MocA family oxidoreductase [Planctomycetota bacterium]|nr:Gfo/Idh/MocA family oxidoreductase [Planctomycetota bacterium]MDA1139785.1 Gfo/Idh/MocA family oxidoreductase [Planctomycetota bacterium]
MTSIPHTKFGLVGCGPRGIDHVQSTQALEGAEWVGACDFSAEARATFEEKTGVKAFESLDELLAQEPEVIGVATTVDSHVLIGKLVLEAGKHLVMEKPISRDAAEGQELVKLAEERGLKGATSFQLHYHNHAVKMKELCRQINPLMIHHARHSGKMRPSYLRPGKSTGVFDYLVHEIDLIRWWTGKPIVAVTGRVECGSFHGSEAPELAVLHFDLGGDECAAATMVAAMAGPPLSRVVQVAGKHGAIQTSFGGEIKWSNGIGAEPQVAEVPPNPMDSTAALYRDLVLSIHGEEVPEMPTLQDGLATVAVIDAAFESHKKNIRVEISANHQ